MNLMSFTQSTEIDLKDAVKMNCSCEYVIKINSNPISAQYRLMIVTIVKAMCEKDNIAVARLKD